MFFGIFAFLLIFITYYLLMSRGSGIIDNGEIIKAISSRIFLIQIESNFIHFDVFPRNFDHIGISSVFSRNMSNFFGLTYSEPSSRIIMEYVEPNKVLAGMAGVRNSLFISEAWANFGILGFILSPIYVGFIIQSLYIFFLKSPKTPFITAFFVYFSINDGTTTGINSYIFNEKVLILTFLFTFSYFLTYILKIKGSKQNADLSNSTLLSINN